MLEAEGWTVWWDSSLNASHEFRDEIKQQIDAAKVAVVLWTEHSATSRWVKAEASRANDDGKLVSVRALSLDPRDIPLPFGEKHTAVLGQHEQLRAAIRAVTERPPAPPRLWKRVRHEAWSWGVVLAAASSFTANLDGLVKFSTLTRRFLENWVVILSTVWSRLLFFLPKVADADAVILSMLCFTAMTIVVAPTVEASRQQSWLGSAAGTAVSFAILMLVFAVGLYGSIAFGGEQGGLYRLTEAVFEQIGVSFAALNAPQRAFGLFFLVMATVLFILAAIAVASVITNRQAPASNEASVAAAAHRLHRIVFGIGILLVLNELSRALETSAPALRQLFKAAVSLTPYFSTTLSASIW